MPTPFAPLPSYTKFLPIGAHPCAPAPSIEVDYNGNGSPTVWYWAADPRLSPSDSVLMVVTCPDEAQWHEDEVSEREAA